VQKSASVRKLPVNLFASVIGQAGLSIAWRVASQEVGVTPLISIVVGAIAGIAFLTRGIPFATGWWAISFLMAALAIASLKYSIFAQSWPVTMITIVLLAMLTIAIVVLSVRTLHILVNGKLLSG
jgi:tellurite resistance protein